MPAPAKDTFTVILADGSRFTILADQKGRSLKSRVGAVMGSAKVTLVDEKGGESEAVMHPAHVAMVY
jgi:hypothetical protein